MEKTDIRMDGVHSNQNGIQKMLTKLHIKCWLSTFWQQRIYETKKEDETIFQFSCRKLKNVSFQSRVTQTL